jgi:hypothetical protein
LSLFALLFLHDLPSLGNLQFEAELDPEPLPEPDPDPEPDAEDHELLSFEPELDPDPLPDPELEPEDADDDELGQLGPLVSDTAELAELDAD